MRNKKIKLFNYKIWTLYSYQDYDFLSDILKKGYADVDIHQSGYADIDHFIKCYNWIKEIMNMKVKNYSGEYPVWSYLTFHKKYYLKNQNYFKTFRLKIRVPKDRCLATCYDLWHCALNNSPVTNFDEFYEKSTKNKDLFNDPYWGYHYIYDIEDRLDKKNLNTSLLKELGEVNTIQVCIDRFTTDDIVEIKPYNTFYKEKEKVERLTNLLGDKKCLLKL